MKSDIAIVIVTYNSETIIHDCLNQLKGLPVLVIDNASSDNTISIASSMHVDVISNNKNIGFGRAANIGFKHSNAPFIMLLNPDVLINQKTIQAMHKYMIQHPKIDILGPKLVDVNGKLTYSCRKFPTLKSVIGHRLGIFKSTVIDYTMSDYDHEKPHRVDWIVGGCMMLRHKIFFDNRFFLYFEDADLCFGKHVVYNPKFVAIHIYRRDSAKKIKPFVHHTVSMIKYGLKHPRNFWR